MNCIKITSQNKLNNNSLLLTIIQHPFRPFQCTFQGRRWSHHRKNHPLSSPTSSFFSSTINTPCSYQKMKRHFSMLNGPSMNVGESDKKESEGHNHQLHHSFPTSTIDLSKETIASLSKRVYLLSYNDLNSIITKIEQQIKVDRQSSDTKNNTTSIEKYNYYEEDEAPFRITNKNMDHLHVLMKECTQFQTLQGVELAERLLYAVSMTFNNHNIDTQYFIYHGAGEDNNDIQNLHNNNIIVGPTSKMYSMVMNAWAKLPKNQWDDRTISPAERTYQLLQFMWQEYDKSKNKTQAQTQQDIITTTTIKPDIIHYTIVFNALTRMKSRKAIHLAESLLDNVEQRSGVDFVISNNSTVAENKTNRGSINDSKNIDPSLIPDRICYNNVLYLWSRYFDDLNSRDSNVKINKPYYPNEVLQKMKLILNKMEQIGLALDDDSWLPNTRSYNFLLGACINPKFRSAVTEAESIIIKMYAKGKIKHIHEDLDNEVLIELEEHDVLPNIHTFNTLMHIYATSIASSEKKVSIAIVNKARTLLKALLKGDDVFGNRLSSHIKPNIITINTYLNALTNSRSNSEVSEAECVLNLLLGMHHSRPSNNNNKEESLGILDDLESKEILKKIQLQPDAITFSTVLQGYAACDDVKNSGHRSEIIFKKMIAQNRLDIDCLKPTESCYAGVVNAWVNEARLKNDASKYFDAESALVKMESNGFRPSKQVLNGLLSIATRNCEDDDLKKDIVSRAQGRLLKMIKESENMGQAMVDVYSFNHVIKANVAFKDKMNRRSALFAAIDTFNALNNSPFTDANDQTYIHILKVLQTSFIEQKLECADLCEELFQQCCEAGLITNAVLRIIEKMLSSSSLRRIEDCKIKKDDELIVSNLPSEWSSNRRIGQNQRRNRNQSWRKH